MHKGLILLVKADSKDKALYETRDFMSGHADLYDYYSIGGRWSNSLAPQDKIREFMNWVEETFPDVFEENTDFIITTKAEEHKDELQQKWEELGLKGMNSLNKDFGIGVPEDGDYYDVQPLKNCIDIVRKWLQDPEEKAAEHRKELAEAEENKDDGGIAYHARQYSDWKTGRLGYDTNVYNTIHGEAEVIPDDIDDVYAVMIDYHY